MTKSICRTVKVPQNNKKLCRNSYMNLLRKCNREGTERFLEYMNGTTSTGGNFFYDDTPFTPHTGLGLIEHIIYTCKAIIEENDGDVNASTVFCALLHGLEFWNTPLRKDIKHRAVYIAQCFFDLTPEEISALKYFKYETPEALNCFKHNPIALELHIAYLRAKYACHGTDEDTNKKWIEDFLSQTMEGVET